MEQTTAPNINSARDLVLLWGPWPDAYGLMAADLGCDTHVTRDWARRNSFPAEWIDPIVNAAQKRGFHEITHAFMAKLAVMLADQRANNGASTHTTN